jgi:hypothetical protein
MARKSYLTILFCLIMLPALSLAQLKDQANVNMSKALTQPGKVQSLVGLLGLDPHKFSMNHSYSLTMGSFGGHGYNEGLYLNTMSYRLTNMAMYFQLGVRHQPFGGALGNEFSQSDPQAFVAGAGFAYKLGDNTSLQFEYRQVPASSYYYSPYSSPFRRSGFGTTGSWFEDERQNQDRE